MKLKKITAAVLCFAFAAGIAGCTEKNKVSPEDSIDSIMEDYTEALQDFDGWAVLDLTGWDDDDREYREIEELLDIGNYDRDVQGCYKIIASKMKVDYDMDDVKLKETKASLNVTYELIDWKMTFAKGCAGYEDMEARLKELKPVVEMEGKISFVFEDGEWKISKITELPHVFSFTEEKPWVLTGTEPTEPTVTEPSATDTVSTETKTDDISEIIDAAVYHLQANEAPIRAVEDSFHEDAVGVYDINGDGITELYYLACDANYGGEVYSADLYIAVYNEFAGEYVRQIVVPQVIYQAADGGCYIMFITDKELIITHSGGEESMYTTETEVFDLNSWTSVARYKRISYYDYNPVSGIETYTYEYFLNGNPMMQDDYNSVMTDYINRTQMVIDRNSDPLSTDIEYPLIGKPSVGMKDYYQAVKYVKSLKDLV